MHATLGSAFVLFPLLSFNPTGNNDMPHRCFATHAGDIAVPSVPMPPWYSDPELLRDRSHVIPDDRGYDFVEVDIGDDTPHISKSTFDVLTRPTSRIVPFRDGRVYVRRLDGDKTKVEPLFLTYDECIPNWFLSNTGSTLAWLGGSAAVGDESKGDKDDSPMDYFVIDLPTDAQIAPVMSSQGVESSPVRSYGDIMPSRQHAALLATASGLLSFHKMHRYCSNCGSPTGQIKAGSARRCTQTDCKTGVYPRIDPAVIMLVTSPCENYALLGRKKSWPSGRYSTLAGFTEVGETLEECVARETLEEAGVAVDPESVTFSSSQPWPFPRSLLVGFRATALPTFKGDSSALPDVVADPTELEDARWFHRDYILENGLVDGHGSSALDFVPDEKEAVFHVPGPASLARVLITEWVKDRTNK